MAHDGRRRRSRRRGGCLEGGREGGMNELALMGTRRRRSRRSRRRGGWLEGGREGGREARVEREEVKGMEGGREGGKGA